MRINKLYLQNFRNYENEEFSFGEGINVLSGDNGQGKTNAVEAVFLLATGYSSRIKRDKQAILYGKTKAEIKAEAMFRQGGVSVGLSFYDDGSKKVVINGLETKKIGELLGNIYAVYFSPQELKLIQESPEDRRRFMDIAISQLSGRYFYSLSKYKRIIEQRNKLLKQADRELIMDTLPVWDGQLAEYSADICIARTRFVKELSPKANEYHKFITDGKENLIVSPTAEYFGERDEAVEKIKLTLKDNLEKDMELGYTSSGPHRDDLKITLNGADVRTFGSQGQQRTSALSLKIAELNIMKDIFGEYPVLILDDAMSELDKNRQKKILRLISGVQTLITCTEKDSDVFSCVDYKQFEICGGKIKRQ